MYNLTTSDEIRSLVVTYNDSDDAVGSYVAIFYIDIFEVRYALPELCSDYYSYMFELVLFTVPISVSYWKAIKSKSIGI